MARNICEHLSELELFGYTILKDEISLKKIALLRAVLEQEYLSQRDKGTLIIETENQAIIRSVFAANPTGFLSLLEQKNIKTLCENVFPDGFVLQSMNASRAQPNAGENGVGVHIDSKFPGRGMANTVALGVAICVDDFTHENGGTLIWPFSHLSGQDPRSLLNSGFDLPRPIQLEASAGDVLIFLAQTWHSVGNNLSAAERWGIFSFVCPWWVKPTWDYTNCGKAIFDELTEFQKGLLGFLTQTPAMFSDRQYTKIEVNSLPLDYQGARKLD